MEIKTNKYKLYQGDCLKVMDKLIKKGVKVDAVVCDPPYGTTRNKWDSIIPLEPMWEKLNLLTNAHNAILLFSSQPYTTILNNSNIKDFKYEWIWVKNNSTGFHMANKKPLKKHELISVFYKKPPTYNPQGLVEYNKLTKRGTVGTNWGKFRSNCYIQKYTNYPTDILEFSSDKKKYHPTQKPIALLEYLIKTYTNEGDIVLDFTMGSGSTGVACLNTNRKFIGIELDENYFNIACDRLENPMYEQNQNKINDRQKTLF